MKQNAAVYGKRVAYCLTFYSVCMFNPYTHTRTHTWYWHENARLVNCTLSLGTAIASAVHEMSADFQPYSNPIHSIPFHVLHTKYEEGTRNRKKSTHKREKKRSMNIFLCCTNYRIRPFIAIKRTKEMMPTYARPIFPFPLLIYALHTDKMGQYRQSVFANSKRKLLFATHNHTQTQTDKHTHTYTHRMSGWKMHFCWCKNMNA